MTTTSILIAGATCLVLYAAPGLWYRYNMSRLRSTLEEHDKRFPPPSGPWFGSETIVEPPGDEPVR